MDINTDNPLDRVRHKADGARELLGADEGNSTVFAAVMVCLALEEVASQMGRIADILTVRLK